MNNEQMKTALADAEQSLAERQKILDAIGKAESELPAIIRAKLDAQGALATIEAGVSLGERKAGEAVAARRRLTETNEVLTATAARVSGLKGRLAAQAEALPAVHGELARHRGPFIENLIETELLRRWRDAADVIAPLLALKNQLEAVTRRTIDLPAMLPAAAPDLTQITHPLAVLDELERAIINARKILEFANVAAKPDAAADVDAVYIISRDSAGMAKGTLVTAQTIGAAKLAWLLKNHFCALAQAA